MSQRPALGRLKPEHLQDKLSLAQKVMREGILQQSNGADYWQEAVVVEIDPIGGMMSDPTLNVGNPRFAIRARLIESTGENTNPDSLRDTDELKVCFPALDMYHVQYPIKIGEKVWVFEKTGIDGVSQRYWVTRSPSPAPISLQDYARPTNNYANASFEANLFRTVDETGGEDQFLDVNQDAQRADLIDRLASENPNDFQDIAPEESRSRTYFSNVVDRDAGRYGFVPELIPELFTRPSDYVAQGSNNNALILGTNVVSIESEDERPDIADILSIYGYTNDASGFTNQRDADVTVESFSPIAAGATEERAFADLVVGRAFNFVSYTFDDSRIAVFEKVQLDNLIPGYSDTISTIKGEVAGDEPGALLRSTNVRISSRNSVALTAGNSSGIYMDIEEGGKLVGNLPFRLELDVNNVKLDIRENNILIDVGSNSSIEMNSSIILNSLDSIESTATTSISQMAGPSSIVLNSAGITLQSSVLTLAAPSISIGPPGGGITGAPGVGGGLAFTGAGSGAPGGLINQTRLIPLSSTAFVAVQSVATSMSGPPLPVTTTQILPALQAIAIFLQGLANPANYSNTIQV